MNINPLASSISNLLDTTPVTTGSSASGSFEDIFSDSFNTVAETDDADKLSALELLAGQADDMSGLLLS